MFKKTLMHAAGNPAQTTMAPVQATPAKNAKAQSTLAAEIERLMQDAEFCDSPGAKFRFGLNRSFLYQLEKEGLIRGVSLRRRNCVKGKKLWCVDSIRDYLNAAMEGGE